MPPARIFACRRNLFLTAAERPRKNFLRHQIMRKADLVHDERDDIRDGQLGKTPLPPIQSQLFDSLRMVASAAAQGMYSRQKTIRHTALRGPNPIPASAAAKELMPAAELALAMPNSTAQLDTTTSLAEIPAI